MIIKDKKYSLFVLALFIFSTNINAQAVEVSPRISDREIIESLAILKQGQIALNKRFDDVNQRFEDINQRFEDVNSRIDGLQNTMLSLFGAIIALIIALFGYIAWDRRTALRPLQERLELIERELHRDLDLQNEEGSLLTRLVKALREMAKTDKKIEEILKSYSLM